MRPSRSTCSWKNSSLKREVGLDGPTTKETKSVFPQATIYFQVIINYEYIFIVYDDDQSRLIAYVYRQSFKLCTCNCKPVLGTKCFPKQSALQCTLHSVRAEGLRS